MSIIVLVTQIASFDFDFWSAKIMHTELRLGATWLPIFSLLEYFTIHEELSLQTNK